MHISTIQQETSHPPISLTNRRLADHVATRMALWLLHWAKRSEARQDERVLRRQERLVRQAEFDRLLDAIADREATIESTLALRAIR